MSAAITEGEYQQILRQYMDDPVVTGRRTKLPWEDVTNSDQVNVQILSVDDESSIFTRLIPIWKTMTVAVRVKDDEGNPVTLDGKYLYDEKEIPVLKKIEKKQIALPFKFFTDDLPKANLTLKDRRMLQRIVSVAYKLMQKQIMEPNMDYTGTLLYLHGLVNSIILSSRGLNAVGLQWAKTQATYSGTIQQTIEQQKFMDDLLRSPNLDEQTKKKVKAAWFDEKKLNKIADWGGGYHSSLEEEGRMIQRNAPGWEGAWGTR